MKIVAISEFKASEDASADQNALIAQAGRVLHDLHIRGILGSIYLRKDHPGTVMILECGTVDDAHLYMSSLPGVIDGTTEYYLIPLGSELPPNALLGARLATH